MVMPTSVENEITKGNNSPKTNSKDMLTAKEHWRRTHPTMLPPENFREDVGIVIPALEEDECLRVLLPKLEPYYKVNVRTEIGLGFAVGVGVATTNTEYIVVMDADGTHQPHVVHQMISVLESEGYDMVCGIRKSWGSSLQGTISREGNKFACKRLGIYVSDVTSGFFVAKREKLLTLPNTVWDGYGDYYIELLAHATHDGWHIGSLSVDYQARIDGRSHTNLFSCTWKYYRRVVKLERVIYPRSWFGRRRKRKS